MRCENTFLPTSGGDDKRIEECTNGELEISVQGM